MEINVLLNTGYGEKCRHVTILSKVCHVHGTMNVRSVALMLVGLRCCSAPDGRLQLSVADPYLLVLKSKTQTVQAKGAVLWRDAGLLPIKRGGIADVPDHFWVFVSI